MSSPAERWFERFRTEGWPLVDELVSDNHHETLHLDFKGKADSFSPSLDRSDRRNFSTALSGFANSEGGGWSALVA